MRQRGEGGRIGGLPVKARMGSFAVVDQVATAPVIYDVHTDHLGRPVAMTNGSQGIAWSAIYQPFGEVQAIIASSTTMDLRFPGQWFQLETGLHYNWHRHYDPKTGHYPQPDPLGFVDGPSFYGYVGGNPLNYTDPNGLWGAGVIGSGSLEAGLVAGAGVTGSLGGGVFCGGPSGVNVGGFVSGGAIVGGPGGMNILAYPCSTNHNGVLGAYAGGGVGPFLTNATSASQLAGPFDTFSLNTPIGSIQFGISGSTWIGSLTVGSGGIGSISSFTTNTWVTGGGLRADRCSCQ